VTYTNWGNAPVRLRLAATDKDGRLGFQLTADQLLVPMGGSATAKLRVRPRDPFLRGSPVHLPFQVRGEQPGAGVPAGPRSAAARAGVPDPTQPVLDAALQQLPILTRGVMIALAALVLAIGAALGLLFRAGGVAGARTADAPPEPPTAVAAQALTASLVHLEWAAPARADGFEVVTTDSRGTGLKSDPVKGAVTALDVEIPQAKPATQYCFQVVALRGEGLRSGPSQKSCATTLTTTLKPPTDVSVTEAEDGLFQVSWKGEKKHSHTVLVDDAPAAPKPEAGPGARALRIQIPAGQHCVTVVAVDGEEASEPSEPVCDIEGVGPSPTPSVEGGGGPVGGPAGGGGATPTTPGPTDGSGTGAGVTGTVAVVGGFFREDDGLAAPLQQRLQAAGITARLVPASELPEFSQGDVIPGTVLVVVENLAGPEEAEALCVRVRAEVDFACRPVQAGS
jgi:hypothetical protein